VLKYTSINDDLCQSTISGVLLKCLAEVAIRDVHDGICGAH
jgi:hypothetical protein